jgi:hypothetical protein
MITLTDSIEYPGSGSPPSTRIFKYYINSNNEVIKKREEWQDYFSVPLYVEELFTWSNNNVIKWEQNSYTSFYLYRTLQYDNKINPLSLFKPDVLIWLSSSYYGYEFYRMEDLFSKNNMTNLIPGPNTQGAPERTLAYYSDNYLSSISTAAVPDSYPAITIVFEYSTK